MKVEKLELVHLAAYLPYELKIKIGSNDGIMSSCRIKDNTIYVYCEDGPAGFLNEKYRDEFKPYLRPLSEYKNFEEITDQMSDNDIHYLNESIEFPISPIDGRCSRVPAAAFMLMCKNHIDVFDLIDSGLAIPITN